MRRLLIALTCVAAAGPASAQTDSGSPAPAPSSAVPGARVRTLSDLVGLCNTPESDPQYPGAIGLCVGYGSGVVDYHLFDTAGRKRARKVCLPQAMPTRGEIRRQFVTWAQSNPAYLEEPAVNGVMRFLIATFPCRPG